MANNTLTVELLRELLHYDPETGLFIRKVGGNGRSKGSVAGTLCTDGYVQLSVRGKCYLAHRLAWFYVHGTWPALTIDHINGIRNDNRIANLRDVPLSVNNQNQSTGRGKSGLLGAHERAGRWQSVIVVDGRSIYLGTFDLAIEAHQAYIKAKRELHEGCTI